MSDIAEAAFVKAQKALGVAELVGEAKVTVVVTNDSETGAFNPAPVYASSTFSAWGSPVGVRQGFNRVTVYIYPFDELKVPTRVRVRVRENGHEGAVLGDVIVGVSAEHETMTAVTAEFAEVVTNEGETPLWLEFFTDGRASYGRVAGEQPYPTPLMRYGRDGISTIEAPLLDSSISEGATTYNMWAHFGFGEAHRELVPTEAFEALISEERDVEFYGPWLVRDWRAQVAKIKVGDGAPQGVLAVFGDSWVANASITRHLVSDLQSALGDAGVGYVSAFTGHTPPDGASRTRTGAWSDSDAAPDSRGVDIAHATSSDVGALLSVTTVADTFVVHYLTQPDGGGFRYRVDDGSWVSVATDDEPSAHAVVTVDGLVDEEHTFQVEIESSGAAGVTIMGVDCQRSLRGVRVHKLGNDGLRASHAVAADGDIWQAGLAALAPNAVAILLGTNDMSANVTPSEFVGAISTMIGRVRAAVPLADVILLAPADNGLEGRTYVMGEYASALRALAKQMDTAFIDFCLLLGPYVDGNARGLYTNSSHTNISGGRVMASAFVDRLSLVR